MKKNMKTKGILAAFFLSQLGNTLVPDLGHLVRHQPMILKANPQEFVVDGSIEIEGEKAPFKITWAGIKEGYTVEFKKLPSSWVTSNVSSLTLFRDSTGCMLVINKAPYPCSTLRFWGDFEFNASPERAVQSVENAGIATNSDLIFKSVNSKELDARKPSKIVPALKTIQGVYMSVLEFHGGSGTLLDFDSLTYAPLFARLQVDGMMWDLTGSSIFNLEKEENRSNLVISKKIEITEGDKPIAIVRREPLKRASKVTLASLPSSRGSVSDVPYDRFSEKGRNFLKVLFLTH